MLKRFRSAFLALLACLAIVTTAAVLAPAAQAVTWTNLGTSEDHQDFDDCTGGAGSVQMKVQWELSSDNHLRLSASYGIKITNNSDARIQIRPATPTVYGDLMYERLVYVHDAAHSPWISSYHYGSSNSYIAPHTTATMSSSSADRWYRMDGVADSNPAPSETAIATGSDPAISLNAFIDTYIQGAWHPCGGDLGYVITLEIKNNAA